MNKILRVVFLLPIFFLFSSTVMAADWPGYRGNNEHTGVSSETINLPMDKKWEYDFNGSGYASPIIVGNYAYVGSSDGKVYAIPITGQTGVVIYDTGASIESTPLYLSGVLYVGSTNGIFYALDVATKALLWSYDTDSNVTSSPVSDGTNVYFAAQNGNVYALDLVTGNLFWASPYNTNDGFTYPSTALVLSKQYNALYIGSDSGVIYAINTSGTLRWSYATGDNCFESSSPAVVGGIVYIGSNNGIVYALNAGTGALSWSYTSPDNSDIFASPAVTSNAVFIGTNSGNVYAIGTSGGSRGVLLWSYRMGNSIKSSPVVAGNYVFIASTDLFYALNTSNGSFQWSYGAGAGTTSPAISDGIVYLTSNKLYAFETTNKLYAMTDRWSYNTGTTISQSGVAVSGGMTYVGDDNGKLNAINDNGTLAWSYQAGGKITTTPVVGDNAVFFGAENNTFYAVNLSDHTLRWSKPLAGPVHSNPAISGTEIYFGVYNGGKFYALSTTNGAEIWTSYTMSGSGYNFTTPIIDNTNDRIYFAYGNMVLISLDKSYGAVVWSRSLAGNMQSSRPSSILLSGSTLYAGADSRIHAFDLSGNLLWDYYEPGVGYFDAGFVEYGGVLVGVGSNGKVVGVNTTTHQSAWTAPTTITGVGSAPYLWQDVVFVMTTSYRAVALNTENGLLRFEYAGNFGPLTPVVTNGILYLAGKDGRIYSEDIDHFSKSVTAATGATFMTVYGDTITIPANALPSNTTITMTIAPNDQGGEGIVALPRKYRFGPDGTTFSPPITVEFAYKQSDLQNHPASDVKVYVWDSLTSTWTASGGTDIPAEKVISVSLSHFSDYALFGGEPALNFPIMAKEYVYGTPVTFNFSAYDSNKVTNIKGYVNGQLVSNGEKFILTKLGPNTFEVTGEKTDGSGFVSQQLAFNVKYAFAWLSPTSNQVVAKGSTLPIKFAVRDNLENFIENQLVKVKVADTKGNVIEFSSGKGNLFIKISESHYLVNFDTSKYAWILSGETYLITVSFEDLTYSPLSFVVN